MNRATPWEGLQIWPTLKQWDEGERGREREREKARLEECDEAGMRRGLGICSHSHPHSKGYDHTSEWYCCSLGSLAPAHKRLSSRASFPSCNLAPAPGPQPPSTLGSFLPRELHLIFGQSAPSLAIFRVWIIPLSSCLSFFFHIHLFNNNKFLYVPVSLSLFFPLSWPTHSRMWFPPPSPGILFIPYSNIQRYHMSFIQEEGWQLGKVVKYSTLWILLKCGRALWEDLSAFFCLLALFRFMLRILVSGIFRTKCH